MLWYYLIGGKMKKDFQNIKKEAIEIPGVEGVTASMKHLNSWNGEMG
ncbi:MAG: hypothetical protein R2765_02925 [Ferruginibacter sp.]